MRHDRPGAGVAGEEPCRDVEATSPCALVARARCCAADRCPSIAAQRRRRRVSRPSTASSAAAAGSGDWVRPRAAAPENSCETPTLNGMTIRRDAIARVKISPSTSVPRHEQRGTAFGEAREREGVRDSPHRPSGSSRGGSSLVARRVRLDRRAVGAPRTCRDRCRRPASKPAQRLGQADSGQRHARWVIRRHPYRDLREAAGREGTVEALNHRHRRRRTIVRCRCPCSGRSAVAGALAVARTQVPELGVTAGLSEDAVLFALRARRSVKTKTRAEMSPMVMRMTHFLSRTVLRWERR